MPQRGAPPMMPMAGGHMMHPQYAQVPYGMVPPGMHPGQMRPGPGQAYMIGPPRGAFPTGFPAGGGYVCAIRSTSAHCTLRDAVLCAISRARTRAELEAWLACRNCRSK